MFDAGPRIFALPPGVDFPAHLVAGLRARMEGKSPDAMAQVRLYVNTQRMRRRIIDLFTAQGATILPRIKLITEIGSDMAVRGVPAAISPLRRRLELTQLVSGLLNKQPDLAPRAALYDLADSLASLMDEMQGEGISPDRIAALDVTDHSAHWSRTQAFLGIIAAFFDPASAPDTEARQRRIVETVTGGWAVMPPQHPVIVAGSTGSRGTTALFMRAVAALPQGALVLPGFDFDMPQPSWAALDDALIAEDHPQFRFRRLLDGLALGPADVQPWSDAQPPAPDRNRLISLSLRPAPVTDQWLTEGRAMPDLRPTTAGMTLIEAPSARAEALSIALILRKAAQDGRTAALITPDRGLTRRVTAALDRWGILPDDSAGRPLALSAPGRFLRHVAGLFGQRLTFDMLLTLLKHPLTATGAGTGNARGTHLRLTRDLELRLRAKGPAFPTPDDLVGWAATQNGDDAALWAAWLASILAGLDTVGTRSLVDHVAHHQAVAEALARGPTNTGSGTLWDKEAGIAAHATIADLQAEAVHGGSLHPADYHMLFDAILNKGEVRETVTAHPHIMIWGTLEARVQGADLVILGGLNDGIWPKRPDPDPWLNRKMRKDAGLLLPERQIGLSAHDYQQAVGAPEVILTRALRDAEAETVPSRWLNRLGVLMGGLPDLGGPQALANMKARGDAWVVLANASDLPTPAMMQDPRLRPARRPAPRPPVAARPTALPLTSIAKLIRDPFEIYAKYILRLRPLNPLRAAPDARDRGVAVHDILERFVKERPASESRAQSRARLMDVADSVLQADTPWPAARALWLARIDRAADQFLRVEGKHGGVPLVLEAEGRLELDNLPFAIHGTPDRIDLLPDGRLHIIDYKTGSPPTELQQKRYDKQLLLAAIMAERGGFADLGPIEVQMITYIGLGANENAITTQITPELTDDLWARFHILIGRYMQRHTGYTSRRALFESRVVGDYDHLARYGEWAMTDRAAPTTVGLPE